MLLMGNLSVEYLVAAGIVLLFGMGIHEYAHALMADWWGDPTPRENGRLTPNPLVHINWIGWLMFLIIGFGILGSVPVNPNRMRDGKWGSFWTALAGPLSNLLQAAIYAFAFRAWLGMDIAGMSLAIASFITTLLYVGVFFNVLLFVFNLLPFFPLDGWTIMAALLPGDGVVWKDIPVFIRRNIPPLAAFMEKPARKWLDWMQASQTVFFALIMISFASTTIPFLQPLNLFSSLVGQPTMQISRALLGF